VTPDPNPELDASPLLPGQIIGERYRVGDLLGGGGMGVVQAGTHVLLGTPVAIKVIRSDLKGDSEVVQRFVNEARAAAALKGEHIARVFDVGLLETGEPYMVMEQLDGVSLDQYVAGRGALTRAEAIDIILQVCEGLAEAHAAGLVHRDIKPANLFLTRRPDGQLSVKILDFGIAKRVDTASPALTNPGKSVGSPWYMSPEQMLTPSSVDQQADVWSLGVLLFELLTARLPFEGESIPQVCANVLAAPAPAPSQYRPDLPLELDAIVLCCLEKEPARRFASVRELSQALAPFASSFHAVVAEPVAPLEPPQAPSYDSLSPLQGAPAALPRRSRARSLWPLAIALVAVAALLPAYWERYSNWGLATSATRAVFAAPPLLPDEGSPEAAALLEREPPRLLQYLDSGLAVPEEDAPRAAVARPPRVKKDEAWRRAQELTREHEVENRYGL
jgi:eukaryotic-like serine/threonine-protein kinase